MRNDSTFSLHEYLSATSHPEGSSLNVNGLFVNKTTIINRMIGRINNKAKQIMKKSSSINESKSKKLLFAFDRISFSLSDATYQQIII